VVIAVVNSKGGVGKTTTSVNLGAALASARRRVLIMDLDSQASASMWLGVPRGRLRPSSASCLLHQVPLAQAIRRTATPHLDLVTGSIELASADLALCDVPGRELALRQLLQTVLPDYELILLDCPPSLSLISVNALVASDGFIVPVVPRFLAAEALVGLLASADIVRSRLASRSRLLGVLLTMVDQQARTSVIRERLRAQYRDRVFHTEIGLNPAIEAAPAASQPVLSYAPRSAAADAYRRLAGEVLERLRPLRH
jgi:chromosome partitioning protein